MTTTGVLLRCGRCRAVNRIPSEKLSAGPKCGKCRSPLEFPNRPVEVTDANFRQEVLDHPGIMLVFFWATWCAHCRGMFPTLEEVARQKAGIVKVGMVNTEKERYLASTFNIMSVPRLTLYNNGRLVDEVNGAIRRPELEQWLAQALNT